MDIKSFWNAVLRQDAEDMRRYFRPDAYVNWHCTNEHFTVDEFIRANCEYPGAWDGAIERVECVGKMYITVVKVFSAGGDISCHVVSFIGTDGERIVSVDEYWGDDGPIPPWRLEKRIGKPIDLRY